MNLKSSLLWVGAGASTAVALAVTPVQAFSFNGSGVDLGTGSGSCALDQLAANPITCQTADGFTLTGVPRGLKAKTTNGVTGVGVQGGAVDDEIDVLGESLLLGLLNPGILTSIDFSFLYQPGEFSDLVFEVAKITAIGTNGQSYEGLLQVTGATSATWSFAGGSAVNLSPAVSTAGGAYRILTPFGNTSITSLVLTAVLLPGAGADLGNSDFSLVGATTIKAPPTTSVPEPGTFIGLGVVGGLLAAMRRRRAIA